MSAKKLYENGDIINGIKVINDLGFIRIGKEGKTSRHLLIAECPFCQKHFETYANRLVTKNTKSCGCNKSQATIDRNYKHGFAGTPLHREWKGMKGRCYNPNTVQFKDWGGRGITVCDEWKNDYMAFHKWSMNNGYIKGLSIDRINNDGNYCPNNCMWIPKNEQIYNQNIS